MAKTKVRKKSKATSKKSSKLGALLTSPVWPTERDIMSRPDRYKYVRKLIPVKGCVFCHAQEAGIGFESLCVYKNAHAMVVLNKYPYNTAHVMVLPVKHCADITALEDVEYQAVMKLLRQTVKIVREEYKPEGLNIGLNLGAVAGAGIPDHMHWHIIPRWFGDTNFFPIIAETKAIPEALETTYERYEKHFRKLNEKGVN